MKTKGTVILPDGIACSGKTTYSRRLQQERSAVLFIIDEVLIRLNITDFAAVGAADEFIKEKACEIANAGVDVILESGYFHKEDRARMKNYFADRDIPYEWHYLDVSPETWRKNIDKRNAAHKDGESTTYVIDETVKAMFEQRFQPPSREEVDVWVDNNY
jgi:predicted kinase